MRPPPLRPALLLAACFVAGCGAEDSEETAPAACLGDSGTYLAALEDAPGEVLLDGETPISACLTDGQGGGQLATVGESAVEAATELNAEALSDPSGEATVRLGYLVGALQEARFADRRHPRGPDPAARRGGALHAEGRVPGRRRSSAPSARDTRPGRTADSLFQMSDQLWGGETTKAVENFPVSGQRVPVPVVRWLGRIKAAAARVNAELGLLEPEIAERIAAAGDAVATGEHDDQFPVDVFQTGSGHLLEHECQRGARQPRRRPGAPERPRQHGPVLERRLSLGGPPGGARRGHR